MGLDNVVSRHTISISNSDPCCDYLGLDEWIPINGIRQRGYRDIHYPQMFPRVDSLSTDPRVFGVSHLAL